MKVLDYRGVETDRTSKAYYEWYTDPDRPWNCDDCGHLKSAHGKWQRVGLRLRRQIGPCRHCGCGTNTYLLTLGTPATT